MGKCQNNNAYDFFMRVLKNSYRLMAEGSLLAHKVLAAQQSLNPEDV